MSINQFSFQDFNKVKIEDIRKICQHIRPYDVLYTEYNPLSIIAWDPFVEYYFYLTEQHLFIYTEVYDYMQFPIGPDLEIDQLVFISQKMQSYGKSGRFHYIPESFINHQPHISDYFEIDSNIEYANYIYLSETLASLKGRKFHKKKNLIRQFKKLYPEYKIEKLNESHFPAILELYQTWKQNKPDQSEIDHSEETAIHRTLKFFPYLEGEGLVIKVGNHLAAYAIFSQHNKNTAVIHFEKFDTNFKGAAQIINQETAKYLHNKGVTFINREEDLGIESLKKSKLSYYPDQILKPYTIILK